MEVKMISLDSILEPAESVRTVIVLEGLEDLANSIKMVGVIQPVTLAIRGEKYEIIAGHRRFLASKLANKGTIPAIISELGPSDQAQLKIHENFFREDLCPIDEGLFFLKMKNENVWTSKDVANFINRTESYVNTRLLLVHGDERVLNALRGKQINVSHAKELLLCEDDVTRLELLRIVIDNGASVNTLRMMRQEYEGRIKYAPGASEPVKPDDVNYVSQKHLISCPCCKGNYEINQIYPISLCKSCYDGFVNELKNTEERK